MKMQERLLFWLCLLTCMNFCDSTISITSPLITNFPNNQIEYAYANFGDIPYAKSLSFDLVVLNHSLCDNITELKHLTKPTYLVILMRDGTYCTETKRSINAQTIGAKGLIIASDAITYSDSEVISSDDGNGKKVHISVLYISKSTFSQIEKLKDIEITVNFPVVKANKSKVSYFISASKRETYIFMRQFGQYYDILKNHIEIQLIYETSKCPWCPSTYCLIAQEYCVFDHQNSQPAVGSIILKEQLTQFNIFTLKGPKVWFDYMNQFDEQCDYNWLFIDACTEPIKKKLGLQNIGMGNDPTRVLAEWRVKEVNLGFDTFPEIAVNNLIYRGNIEAQEVFQMVCSSLNSPPRKCFSDSEEEPKKSKKGHIVLIILVVIAGVMVFGLGVCIYRKFIKKELTNDMSAKVSELVAKYATKVSEQNRKHKEKMMERLNEQL